MTQKSIARRAFMAGYKVNKSIADINKKIRQGKAVVLNAEDMIELVKKQGKVKAAAEVDVVTTGTFSTMCSSGLLFNQGQEPPVMKTSKVWLNNVPAYGGIAAVDAFLGATEPAEDDPLNKVYPGRFVYGGGHVFLPFSSSSPLISSEKRTSAKVRGTPLG